MAVPSPSIRPALVPGGVHRAIYMGTVGISSTPTAGDYATGVVRLRNKIDQIMDGPQPEQKYIGPGGLSFSAVSQERDGFDWLIAVRADEVGPAYNLLQGAILTVDFSVEGAAIYDTNTVAVNDFYGGAAAQPAQSEVHLDLTAFSPYVRGNPYFADQLEIWIQPLDAGITQVLPQVVRKEDMIGSPPEYLTLTVANDDIANQWVIWVHALHSHHR